MSPRVLEWAALLGVLEALAVILLAPGSWWVAVVLSLASFFLAVLARRR